METRGKEVANNLGGGIDQPMGGKIDSRKLVLANICTCAVRADKTLLRGYWLEVTPPTAVLLVASEIIHRHLIEFFLPICQIIIFFAVKNNRNTYVIELIRIYLYNLFTIGRQGRWKNARFNPAIHYMLYSCLLLIHNTAIQSTCVNTYILV